MHKSTPGPWRYVRESGSPTTGQHMIAGARPGYLAEVRDCGSGDVEANAHLIASAPDLLAALESLLAQADQQNSYYGNPASDSMKAAIDAAEFAIAKAKGGAK